MFVLRRWSSADHSSSTDDKYAVVPSFGNFTCPTTLPPSWSEAPIHLATTFDLHARDPVCRITASTDALDDAHIIPAAHEYWWQRNLMFRFTARPGNSQTTSCADNMLRLRTDLHRLWDDGQFAIVPKDGKWVIHFLQDTSTSELHDTYHNLELQRITGVSPMFLLCRFALAIFTKSVFLSQNTGRKLVCVSENGEIKNREFLPEQCRLLFGTARARSGSPKKRSRSAADSNLDDEYLGVNLFESDDFDWEMATRGRRRKRSGSPLYSDNYLAERLEIDRYYEMEERLNKRRRCSSSHAAPAEDPGLESNGDAEVTCTESSTSPQSPGGVSPETTPRKSKDATFHPLDVGSDSCVDESKVVSHDLADDRHGCSAY